MPRPRKNSDQTPVTTTIENISDPEDETQMSRRSTYVVIRTFTKDGKIVSESADHGTIAVHKFITQPAEVGLSFGGTINLGNFESARLDISLKIPVYREEVDEGYRFVFRFADERLNEELGKITAGSKAKEKEKDFSPF